MKLVKPLAALGLGLGIAGLGWWISQSATNLAWPNRFINSEMQQTTEWAMKERLYEIGGLIVLGVGAAISLFALLNLVREATVSLGKRHTGATSTLTAEPSAGEG